MASIIDLLMALNQGDLPPVPDPAKPVGMAPAPAPPISTGPAGPLPDVPPTAPTPGIDQNLLQQFLALRGPAPTAPTPPSRGQRIANALIGFGAGIQGNGPQFLQQLREPQRQYEAQQQAYNSLGTQLGVMGLNAAQEKQQRQQAETQRRADEQARRDFEVALRKSGVTDEMALTQMRNAFELDRQRQHDQFLAQQAVEKERADREKQARLHERELIDKEHYPPTLAKEIADYTAGIRPEVSAAAQKYQSVRAAKLQLEAEKIQKQIGRLNGVGVGGAGKLADEFENLKRQLYPLRDSGDYAGERSVMRKLEAVGSKLQSKGYEVGYGDNPYQKPPQARQLPAQQAPTGGQTFTRAQVNAYATKKKRNPADVEADLKARGFNVQ